VEKPIALLLLPRQLEEFILRDQARDLLRAPRVVAVEPARMPYGAYARLPRFVGRTLAWLQARRLRIRLKAPVAVVVMFHPLQLTLAEALLARYPKAELWYSRWDRYEHAYDASPRLRTKLEALHARAAGRADFIFAVSDALAEIELESGRHALVVPSAHDSFPAPDPESAVIAVSLGHLGWRTDWALLRRVLDGMPELTLLLVGDRHDGESEDDGDFAAVRGHPRAVWLGRLGDEAAARIVLCADVGIVPFKVEPFNDAGLPQRIMKYARVGRRTIAPDLRGVRTWERAITVASGADAWIAALRAARGARVAPELELREWALEQTAFKINTPLWDRLETLGVAEFA
jgi:glycosyltransferase involved in cell wall biosynthesis